MLRETGACRVAAGAATGVTLQRIGCDLPEATNSKSSSAKAPN
jgi:hypothetical protein